MSLYPSPRIPEQPRASADEGQVRETYLQALYVVFWKAIFIVLGFFEIIIAYLATQQVWADAGLYVWAVIALIIIPLAYLQLKWFARAMRWDNGPIINWAERRTILLAVGYTPAMALAIFLAIQEADNAAAQQRAQEASQAERAKMRVMIGSPDYKRAMEFMRKHDEMKEAEQTHTKTTTNASGH